MNGNIPEDWEVKKLGEVTNIFKGGTPKSNVRKYFEGNIPWATPTDITNLNGRLYISDTKTHISKEALGKSSARLLPPGTVLLTSRATIGKVAIAKTSMSTNQGFANFICKTEVDNVYLAYYLQSITDLLISLAGGTTFLEITKRTLLNVEIPLPPLTVQRKIASILSAYDDLIENNTQRIKILEKMVQLIFREWFVYFRFPTYQSVKMVKSDLGLIPEGWAVKPVSQSFEILGGGTPSKKKAEYWEEGTINWYIPSDLTVARTIFMEESSTKINELGLRKSSARLFPAYSVMMTSRATIGVVAISTTTACTNQGFIVCIPNEKVPLYYLYFWLLENTALFINMGSGTTFKEITKTTFKTVDVLIPPQTIVTHFEEIVKPLMDKIFNLQRQNKVLRHTRDLLHPKLFSGEIDVFDFNLDVS